MGFAYRPRYPHPDAAIDACGAAIGRAGACCHDGGPEHPGRGFHDGHHRGRDRAFAGLYGAGDHRAGARSTADIAVRCRERRANQRRPARLRRHRCLQHADPHQWPQGERHRYAGRGPLHDSTRFDRAHRNHQRQQRRRSLWRQCHGRRHQHRHQDRGDGPAAGRARRGRRRVLRPAPGRGIGFRECGTVVNVVLRQPDQFRWIPRQQQTLAAKCRRRHPLHHA